MNVKLVHLTPKCYKKKINALKEVHIYIEGCMLGITKKDKNRNTCVRIMIKVVDIVKTLAMAIRVDERWTNKVNGSLECKRVKGRLQGR